jgi:predicted PurR-regulated permease PerM
MLGLIITLGILLFTTLYVFLPGLLGGITLYILTKKFYTQLTVDRKWNEEVTAILFISILIILIAVPLYFSIQMVIPRIKNLIDNQKEIIIHLEVLSKKAEPYLGKELFSRATATSIAQKLGAFIPSILNTSANWISNFFMMFFFLFYFLYSNKSIEKYLNTMLPLKKSDIIQLSNETVVIIRANALGIPIVSIVHGIVACIGYFIFGVKNWAVWGFLTGLVAFLPIVGIMIVWVPMVLYYYSIDQNFTASAVGLYSLFITGNVDYITRIGMIKKIFKVHPMVTVLGVIVGLKLFGFIGLIFGPLFISYFIILVKFYTKEFIEPSSE